jgi:hypothetical protein
MGLQGTPAFVQRHYGRNAQTPLELKTNPPANALIMIEIYFHVPHYFCCWIEGIFTQQGPGNTLLGNIFRF